MHRAGEETTNVRWMSRSTLWGRLPPPNAFVNLNIETRLRMLVDWSPLRFASRARGPTHGEQFAEAALMGSTDRALKIIDLWAKGEQMPSWLKHAVAKLNVISPDAFRRHVARTRRVSGCGY